TVTRSRLSLFLTGQQKRPAFRVPLATPLAGARTIRPRVTLLPVEGRHDRLAREHEPAPGRFPRLPDGAGPAARGPAAPRQDRRVRGGPAHSVGSLPGARADRGVE